MVLASSPGDGRGNGTMTALGRIRAAPAAVAHLEENVGAAEVELTGACRRMIHDRG